ncbi:hypothetical protein C2E20_6580 [Micractinium conductrix]|uniref:Uncharacterized protein n=1 Tax=Micractinium conductrix TaxID=554055 RepID=A0A2P6V776_9CHLO|nr:hypothetical protein C2E20_6580 [Micractinium conductrix]|eukprot:PSC69944.1 hypothetical protein C2E20_6580 [Micractinium conductrix]
MQQVQPGSPQLHVVAPPSAANPAGAPQAVPLLEAGLINVMLCEHRRSLTLLDHFTLAAAQGNAHTVEILAGALAIDIRLHSAGVLGVLCPLLERRYASALGGPAQAAALRAQLQAVERGVLEMLTLRRERDWVALAGRVNLVHKDYAAHIHELEVGVLPRLAADVTQEELVSTGLLLQQQQITASLVPEIGDDAFAAAGRVGPEGASVLGGPLIAGSWQPHRHHPGAGAGGRAGSGQGDAA